MVEDITDWFERAVPNPNEDNFSVQLGCHFEEFGEMLDALQIDSVVTDLVYQVADQLKRKVFPLEMDKINRVELLDALCDQIVTATGVGYMLRMNVPSALDAVNVSNWSKFDENGNPIFNELGKIMKSDHYFKPSIERFV